MPRVAFEPTIPVFQRALDVCSDYDRRLEDLTVAKFQPREWH
jgi:hypothetical protein